MERKQARKDHPKDGSLLAILLPIVSLAVRSRVGVDTFVQAAKRAYVQAAMQEAFAGSLKVNYSRIAVITGLTRKEVAALVGQIEGSRNRPTRASREQRALRVVRGWRMDPRFQDEKGRPAELPLRVGQRTFVTLVKAYAGDVTPVSVLGELERLNLVSRALPKNKLRLLSRREYSQTYATQNVTEIARLLSDFINTVSQKRAGETPPVFFSFRDSALSLRDQAARFERVFSNRAAALLEGFDQWIATQTRKETGAVRRGSSQARVGVGVYLVNEAFANKQGRTRRRTGA